MIKYGSLKTDEVRAGILVLLMYREVAVSSREDRGASFLVSPVLSEIISLVLLQVVYNLLQIGNIL